MTVTIILKIIYLNLIYNNTITPIAAVFLNPWDINNKQKNLRQELFLCNSDFTTFFTNELMPEVEKLYPVSNKR